MSDPRRDPRFSLGKADMYKPAPGAFDVIRVMSAFSLLNQSQVERALQAICTPLVEGGLLIFGRNRGRQTHEIPTTVFARQGQRLIAWRDLMGGAEERAVALGLRLVTEPPPLPADARLKG